MARRKLTPDEIAEKRLSNYYCDDEEEEKLRAGTWEPKKKKSPRFKSLLLINGKEKERTI